MTNSNVNERRRRKRIPFEAPASVTADQQSMSASTKDISERGLFIFVDGAFQTGCEIDVLLTVPEGLGLDVSGVICCHGRVIRSDSVGGQHGIAVQIDRYAQVPQV